MLQYYLVEMIFILYCHLFYLKMVTQLHGFVYISQNTSF